MGLSSPGATIRCRSKVSPDCYDGKDATPVYGDPDWTIDGTYDPETNTVVCDPCYLAVGQPGIPIDHPEAPGFGANIEKGDPR